MIVRPLKIKNVTLATNLVAAPVAGYTDVGFRALAARYGAGMTVTELVSAKGLCYHTKGNEDLIATTDDEKVKCVQIFGSEPEFMRRATEDERLQKFDVIDINMGCPVRKVVANGDGSALMNNPQLVEKIVRAVVDGANGRPVSVKMRAGYRMGEMQAVDCALAAEASGADLVSVHARYRDQFYAGVADHSVTALVKKAVKIPVVANGDIVDLASLERVAETTEADAFMIGRGMLGKPWIFEQLRGLHDEIDLCSVIFEHINLLLAVLPERTVCSVMKAQLCQYSKNTVRAKAVRCAVAEVKNLDDIKKIVLDNFAVNIIF